MTSYVVCTMGFAVKDIVSVEEYRDLLKASSSLERAFEFQLITRGDDIAGPEKSYRFHPQRNWAFDFAWPDAKVAVELEGGAHGRKVTCHNCGVDVRALRKDGSPGKVVHTAGWHGRVGRFNSDMEKYNEAQRLGWIVIRFSNENITGDPFKTLDYLRDIINERLIVSPMIESLSDRENAVLHCIAAGLVTPIIAQRLNMAKATVRGHAQKINQKLNVSTRAAAVARAAAWGLLDFNQIPWTDEYHV